MSDSLAISLPRFQPRIGSFGTLHEGVSALWSVAQAIARIRSLIAHAPRSAALQSFLPAIARDEPDHDLKARAALASTLVAGLELAREGELALRQEESFSMIEMRAI